MRYIHSQNKDKEFIDWRNPSRRKEGFLKWLKWRMRYGDLDHYVCNNSYRDAIGKMSPTGKSMTKEQAHWFSLIFGMTYQSEMAWVIYWNFPDFWSINIEELEKWNLDNIDRQRYARDTKYNKGRIVSQVKSLQNEIGPSGSIEKFFGESLSDDENESFEKVFNSCMRFHKYGGMTSWLTCQLLFETANVPIKPDTVRATTPWNWSVRSGLMYAYNRDDKIEATCKDVEFCDKDIEQIKEYEKELYELAKDCIDENDKKIFSNYLLESHLCQYKKLMLGGDYAGHSSGDHFSRALWLSERWPEVNFDVFFKEAIKKHCPIVRGKRESKQLRFVCSKTGQMINMHEDFQELPNMYLELGINPDWFYTKEYDEEVGSRVDSYANKIYNSNWW